MDKIVKYLIRCLTGYWFFSFVLENMHVDNSLYIFTHILKWTFIISIFFLFPNFLLNIFKINQKSELLRSHFSIKKDFSILYKIILYVGFGIVIVSLIYLIINYIFPEYQISYDFQGHLVKRLTYTDFKLIFYPLLIIIGTYLPILFYSSKISNHFYRKVQKEGDFVILLDIYAKTVVIYLLIYNFYSQILFLFEVPHWGSFKRLLESNIQEFLANFLLTFLISFILLFKSKPLFKLIGVYSIQKYLTMNNIDLLQEKAIYRITLLISSFTILILFIIRVYTIIDILVFRDIPAFTSYEPWITILVLIFCIAVIYFNKRIADFLVKN